MTTDELIAGLDRRFSDTCEKLITMCKEHGATLKPVTCVRTPIEQARLWKQSRSQADIDRALRTLNKGNAPYLAFCLENAHAGRGPQVTQCLPGYSWHQWGMATDFAWMVGDSPCWTVELHNPRNGYALLGAAARYLGVTWGGEWSTADPCHVQGIRDSVNVCHLMSIIDEEMFRRFGH